MTLVHLKCYCGYLFKTNTEAKRYENNGDIVCPKCNRYLGDTMDYD